MAGANLVAEGAGMLGELYPDIAERPGASIRLMRRARALLDSGDQAKRSVGFFLYGLAKAAADNAFKSGEAM